MDRTIGFTAYLRGKLRLRTGGLLVPLLLLPPTLAAAPCDPPITNPILCENTKAGNPSTEWEVSGAGDPSIQGFATDISVNHGTTVYFKVDTNSSDYRIDIYRLGYYGGSGARKVATVQPSAVLPQVQPACLNDPATGLKDCGNWAESASWAVPADAVSGIYIARLVREDASPGESHMVFIVRDDEGHSPILFQTSDTTWQAYNQYGGNSLYVGGPGTNPGRAYKVSYNRPFTTRGTSNEDWLFNSEYPMVRWLEANGYNVSYFTGVDSDRIGNEILDHQVFLSVGHDEYWSGGQRTQVEAARAAGVRLAFFSGNEIFWKTRWEASIDGSGTAHRTLVCYKETHAGAKIDPDPAWTGTWRDNRAINPQPLPENALSGTIFTVNCCSYPMTVSSEDGKMRLWRNTTVATLTAEETAVFPSDTVGYEWDEDLDNGSRPPGLFRMSSTTVNVPQRILDQGSTYGPGTATHSLTLYKHASGALVFGAGTVQWIWGLDSHHDRGSESPDVRMQQATVNLLADLGVQPGSLQAGLVSATASTDATPPTSQVTSPADGSNVSSGSSVLISGTAADSGGVVGGVEVSTDGGTTWHRASGRSTWTYTWTVGAAGSAVIRSRAVDDSGNLESPGPGVSVTIGAATCPCSIWNDSFTPAVASENDTNAVELGVKFRSDVAGFVTGARFYKGTLNTGTHTAHLWSSAGALLGSMTFTGETASGWQQSSFPSAIAISANTTYVISYHTGVGRYAADGNYFGTQFGTGPLHALADGFDGPNGVYHYGATAFPTDTFNKSNYWVDVVFNTTAAPDTTPPTVVSVTPPSGAGAVNAQSNVTATFSEPMDAATITSATFQLRDGANALVPAAVTYDPATLKATLNPNATLSFSSSYTATVHGGAGGVTDASGNELVADYTWSFTTAGPPPPPPDQGPGGPILVVSGTNAFGRYSAEILRAEGLNAFDVKALSTVSATTLGNYDVVILGETPLTGAQVTMFTDWVTAGGNLIAMRPAKALAGLLGLTDANATLSNAYLKVDTAASPGTGIVSQSIQFHGTADLYTLSGATEIARLYSTSSVATPNPAVTVRSVGTQGGHAAAFAFDLARSIVYTRQGNPAWAGDSRDGQDGPIRADNLFFGAKPGDVQPDWVDFSKIAIPQADEQQRLLANLIGFANLGRKPLPRFWYFPKGKKAVVVMTGDDHANGGTAGRFEAYKAARPANCSVVDWDCVRSTSYVYNNSPLSDAQAASYDAQGFEVGLHVTTFCDDFTPASLEADFADQLAAFTANYTSIASPSTNRTHCIAWSDWATHPKVELAHGIRLDTNYYYWPPEWIANRPGLFTGSGMPMRFADLDGTMIDVYQATTQMTDESNQSYPLHIDTLLDNALGATGYYGAFTANMHTDQVASAGSDAILGSALSRGVPIVSAKQMLEWVDGRNASSFGGLAWGGNALAFTITVGAGANNIQAMVPKQSAVGALTGITRGGNPVATTVQTIKGVDYAFFAATAGSYVAQYAVDTTPPVISAVVATPGSGDATVTWTTDEASTSIVDYGTSAGSLGSEVTDGALVTSHSIHLIGLAPSTTYYYRVTSVDVANNPATSPNPPAAPASFATTSLALVDTTVADFSAGTTGANTAVSQIADGEVILAPTVEEEFGGTTLPASWTGSAGPPWPGGGSVSVSSGLLTVDGARAYTNASYGAGRVLEFVATFGAATFEHLGFAGDGDSNPPWIFFSTFNSSTTLYARTHTGGATIDNAIPGSWIGSPHLYRIEWNASSVRFFIDGTLVDTQAVAIAGPLRVIAAEFNPGGGALSVDWIRLSPYASSGVFTSRVFDAGQTVGWGNASWTAGLPAGTAITLAVRTGNTPVPDGTWTGFTSISNGGVIPGSSRYIQYQAVLSTSDPTASPILQDVTLGYGGNDTTPPTIAGRTPSPNATDVSVDANVTVQFSEPMNASTIDGTTFRLRKQGAGTDVAAAVSYGGNTATLDPDAALAPNAVYQVTVAGTVTDASGNPLGSDDTWTFTTGAITGSATDTTVADFSAGTLDANTRVSQIGDGEVILAGAVNEEFSGSALPAGWSGAPWGGGGSVAVSGGQLTVDGARAGTDASFAPGLALEFVATFGAAAFEHVGFAGDFDSNTPWIYFSTKDTTGTLYARTHTGSSAIDNAIPGSWIGTPHRYRIEWTASTVRFLIDGNLVDTHAVSIPNSLRILASEFNSGAPSLSVDWARLSPYAAAGTFLSRIFDAGAGGSWTSISSTSDLPAGTSIALSVRTGTTPTPDGNWSAFTPVPGSGGPLSSTSRYLQYRADLATSDPLQTPALRDVTVGFTVSPVTHTLTVTRTGTGAATSTVMSTPAGINCGATCVKSFDGGTVVTLTPTPGATYVFGGWSGDADCADGVVTMDADKTCTAAFNKKPDLTVSVLTSPASAGAGATITVTDTTKNLSGGPAFPGTSNTKIWLSTDAVLDAGDTLLGTRPVPSLNPLASSTGSTSVVIPSGKAPGSYFLIANADADGSVPESNEGNNVRTKTFTVNGPDLSVTALTAPTASGANRTISISDTTRNTTGASPAPASTTSYYLSTDSVWDGADIFFGSRAVPALASGAQNALTTNQTLPSVASGNYFIIAKADGPLLVAESNEANNTRAKAIAIGADLSVSVVGAPVKSGAGLSITVTDTTANAAGRSDVADSTTAYYFSSDAVLGGDTLVGSRTTGAIPSGGNSQGSATVTIPAGTATGTWYIIAKADNPNGVFETSETNNTRAKSIAIGPDLIVLTIAAPLSAHPGQTINVTPTTKNQGGGSSGVSSTTKIYLRPPSGPDTFLGTRNVPTLAPNASDAVAVSVTIPAGTPTGSYNLFVVADDGNAVVETSETNNTKLKAITIN